MGGMSRFDLRLLLIVTPSMIIDNLDLVRVSIAPYEANPPLLIDADAVLTGTVAA
jgi:hypothetical protein